MLKNWKEIKNNELQSDVTLRKVCAGKATGRACRLKQDSNGGLGDGGKVASNQNAFVCVCV